MIFRLSPGEQIDLLQNGEENYVEGGKAWVPKHRVPRKWGKNTHFLANIQREVDWNLQHERGQKEPEKKKSIRISKLSFRSSVGLESRMS